ncbi:hypothetical protein DMH15_12400 [Streptomyces sp. WAC 06725]|uniref:hypothetical protein n=1 Tax=Streptomyces sp. WAC 06725 TaxID=2203209 RepID=UPI000F738109|nr:hypothetical protein [Streptomyces sp. WAC 06725]RSO42019.1 hypothetical protein DMH15_12400 [Streptomyces sp. WAC 06725]
MSHNLDTTVGDFIDQLSALDRDAVLRLAVNPFFPMSHHVRAVVATTDAGGRSVVYIADGQQEGHLPPEVARRLTWHPDTEGPRRARRGARPADPHQ